MLECSPAVVLSAARIWHSGDNWTYFWLSKLGEGCYWLLVARGQGCSQPLHNAQGSHPDRIIKPKMSIGSRVRHPVLQEPMKKGCPPTLWHLQKWEPYYFFNQLNKQEHPPFQKTKTQYLWLPSALTDHSARPKMRLWKSEDERELSPQKVPCDARLRLWITCIF